MQELTGSSDDYEDSGLEARADELENQLRRAVVILDHARTRVDLSSVVTLQSGAEELQVQLVSPVEAEVVGEDIPHISDVSPLGKALLGRRPGETFTLQTGSRTTEYTVVAIR